MSALYWVVQLLVAAHPVNRVTGRLLACGNMFIAWCMVIITQEEA
jgi:hypothetical protein